MTSTLIRPVTQTLSRAAEVEIGVPAKAFPLATGSAGVQFVLCPPNSSPSLWAAYCEGAEAAYARHGVTAALRLPAATVDDQHPWFAAAVDTEGEVVAGLRVNGPLVVPGDAAALRELSSSPAAERRITDILEQTLADGVIEIKGFWVANGTPGHREIAATLTGSTRRIASVIGVRHALCTAAEHAAGHWRRAGGVPLMTVPAVPYPTADYSTRVHWWDALDPGRADLVESVPSTRVPAPRRSAVPAGCLSVDSPARRTRSAWTAHTDGAHRQRAPTTRTGDTPGGHAMSLSPSTPVGRDSSTDGAGLRPQVTPVVHKPRTNRSTDLGPETPHLVLDNDVIR